jgi:hypothetical protein
MMEVISSKLNLKLIAIHDNSTGANVCWSGRTQDLASPDIVLCSVPWARNDHTFHLSLRQGPPSMRACIADGIEFAVGIENCDPLSFYFDRDRLT